MTLDELEGEELERADELLGEAAHDVAKYMALTARNVEPDEVDAETATHILRELSATDGVRPAWEIWGQLSQELSLLSDDERITEIDEAMTALALLVSRPSSAKRGTLVRKTLAAADSILVLRRSVRRALSEGRR